MNPNKSPESGTGNMNQTAFSTKGRQMASKKEDTPRSCWLCVFENDGEDRTACRPHVSVKPKMIKPGPDLDHWLEKRGKRKKQSIKHILYDLMPCPEEPGGAGNPFVLPAERALLKKAKATLIERLRSQGYTVGNDLTVWHLYAIELKPPKRPREQHRGYLYVGQTSLDVEERIKQHRLGPAYPWKDNKPKHSRPCHEGFVQPRLDLIPERFRQTLYSKESALVAESDLRRYFEGLGYKVKGGTERYKQRKKQK